MAATLTRTPASSDRASFASSSEWTTAAPTRRSSARTKKASPGRRSCGSTLWQITTVRPDEPDNRRSPSKITRYDGTWMGVSNANTTKSAERSRRPAKNHPSGRYQASRRRVPANNEPSASETVCCPGYSREGYCDRHDSITTSCPAAASRCASSVVCRAPPPLYGCAGPTIPIFLPGGRHPLGPPSVTCPRGSARSGRRAAPASRESAPSRTRAGCRWRCASGARSGRTRPWPRRPRAETARAASAL